MKNVLSISTGWKGNLTVPTLKPSSDHRQTHIDSYEEEESIDDDGDDDDDNYDNGYDDDDDDDVTSLVEYFLPFGSLH